MTIQANHVSSISLNIYSSNFDLKLHYATTIQKAILNRHCDLSMSIDATGTVVLGHGLHYVENVVIGQPAQHECLKVSTFIEYYW